MSWEPKFKQTEMGMIPEGWEVKEIQNVGEVIGGGTPSTKNRHYWGGEIAWITAKDLSNHKSRYIKNGERNITKEGLLQSSAKILPKGSVLLTTRAPVGYLAIAENDVTTNQGFHSIIPKENTTTLFLYYLLKRNVEYLKSNSSGTTFGELSGSRLKSLNFSFPSLIEQQTIAKILSGLDSKVELNQRMNKSLEGIAQAVFKRWFVDFEFPNQEGKPYKSSGGEMDSADFGEIPQEWSTKPFSEVIAVNPLRKIAKDVIATKVEMSDLNPWQPWIDSWNVDKYKSGSRFQNGDILFARITPCLENGKTAFVSFLNKNEVAFGSTEFIVLSPKTIQSSYYILYLAISKELRESAILSMNGSSGRQRVPNAFFDDFVVVLPPNELLRKFDNFVAAIFEKETNNMRESRSLKAIRDNLLPRLMSGKIRVPINDKKEIQ